MAWRVMLCMTGFIRVRAREARGPGLRGARAKGSPPDTLAEHLPEQLARVALAFGSAQKRDNAPGDRPLTPRPDIP